VPVTDHADQVVAIGGVDLARPEAQDVSMIVHVAGAGSQSAQAGRHRRLWPGAITASCTLEAATIELA
jgi:hypothetical protein